MNDRIINLVGPSGSGKTTIAKELEKMGYNIIMSYTTREQREPNEWGHTFIDKSVAKDINIGARSILNSEIIALKEIYEGYHYWATKEQYQGKGTSIYVVCPDGAKQVHENVKDAEVVTIFLYCNESKRANRMVLERPIEEIQERFRKDKQIFKTCKCDYTIDANREVKEVLEDVVSIIERAKL